MVRPPAVFPSPSLSLSFSRDALCPRYRSPHDRSAFLSLSADFTTLDLSTTVTVRGPDVTNNDPAINRRHWPLATPPGTPPPAPPRGRPRVLSRARARSERTYLGACVRVHVYVRAVNQSPWDCATRLTRDLHLTFRQTHPLIYTCARIPTSLFAEIRLPSCKEYFVTIFDTIHAYTLLCIYEFFSI